MSRKRLGWAWSIAFGLICAPTASAGPISFSGDYAPANWTLTTNGGNGSVDTSGAPFSITLFGSNSWSDYGINTLYSITVPSNVTLDFQWSYLTSDASPYFDPAGYRINAYWTQLSNDNGAISQSGFVSGLSLSAGDTLSFYVDSIDDMGWRAQITISSAAVPEPGTLGLLGAGLGLMALWRRRR